MDLLWWHAHWPYRLQQKITAVANKTAMTIHTLFFKPRIEERIKRGNSSTLQFISSHCDDECCFIFRALAMLFVTGTFFGCLFIVDHLLYVFKQVFPAEWSQINTYISFLPFFICNWNTFCDIHWFKDLWFQQRLYATGELHNPQQDLCKELIK